MGGILDRLDDLESRMSSKPTTSVTNETHTYASAVKQPPDHVRLDRLEFIASETERRKRSLELTITHPNIDNTKPNLHTDLKNFFSTHMNMENREIDLNCIVKKVPRKNTVCVSFSDKNFKRFLLKLENA